MDLKYVLASEDGGETWREPIAQPSLEKDNAVGRAFVEVRFTLQNPRSTYPPFDTAVFLNDVRIGEIKRAVPEGTYVWEAPADIVRCGAQSLDVNQISMKFGNLSGGHYILAADSRLIVQRRYTQVPVVAASQAEADALADRSGSGLNHSAPDLALAANSTAPLPAILVPGQKIDLRLQVFNLGEGAASDVRISIFGSDPRDSAANPDPGKLAEVRVGTVGPGEVKTADVEFTYDPARVPRIFASVSAREKDFFAADNTWGFALTKGESDRVSPLFGTDIPDVLRAPGLLNIVSVPNMRGLVDMASLPGLEKLVGKSGLKLPDMGEFTNTLRDKLKRLDWKDVDLNRLFKR